MSIQTKHQFVSYQEEEEEDFEELNAKFLNLRLAHERLNDVTQKAYDASRDANGVAIFDDGEDDDYSEQGLLSDDDSGYSKGDNETVATCTVSIASTVSSKSTTFVSSVDGDAADAKMKGSQNVKTRLRALASVINPKLSQNAANRRGIWSGILYNESQELGIEVEYCQPGDLYEC